MSQPGRMVAQVAMFIGALTGLGWATTLLGLTGAGFVMQSGSVELASIGLAAGVVARTSGRRRSAFLAATVLASVLLRCLVLRGPIEVALLYGVANAFEALVLALLLPRLCVGRLISLRQTARFLLAAIMAAVAGGMAALPAVDLAGLPVPLGQAVTVGFLSHLVGLVVIAAPVLAWPPTTAWTVSLAADVASWAVLLGIVTHIGFNGSVASIAFPYMPLAVVLFATVRLGAPAASVLLPLLVPAAIWYSARGFGPFANMARGETAKVIAVLLFCLTAGVTCWLVAARQSEARSAARGLAEANTRLGQTNAELEERVAARTADLERAAAAAALTARVAQSLAEARLDLTATMNAVAHSLSPLGDLCVVSRIVSGGHNVIQPVAVAAITSDLTRAVERDWFPVRIGATSPGLTGRALATARAVRAGGSPQALAEMSHPAFRRLFLEHGLHSALVAPMRGDGQVVGSLVLVRGGSRPPFDADEESLVQDLADRAGLAVANATLHEELADRALTDPLTGLANRRLFHEQLRLALHRLARHPGCVAVLFADLDDFKTINDALGHDAGDKLLVQFAERMRGVLRGTDTAARVGGDEFVAVCPDLADARAARAIADRLATAAAVPVQVGGRTVHLGASIGVAVTDCPMTDPDELIHRADIAMYTAKRRGSARPCLHGEDAVAERDAEVAVLAAGPWRG